MIGLSIRRPVAVSMVYVCIAVLGFAAWRSVPVEHLPDSLLPRLTVTANWRGGSPEIVEAFLTAPMESVIQQIRGVEKIVSTSTENRASISIEFARDTDMDLARLDLSERLAGLERELPRNTSIQITHVEPQEFARQRRPFLSYDVTGPFSLEYLAERTEEVIAAELRQIVGVQAVEVFGGRPRVLEIVLDDTKLNALGLPLERVIQAIQALEQVGQLGTVRERGTLRAVTIRERPENRQAIEDALLLIDQRRTVRIRDVGTVHETYAEPTGFFRINGFPAVSFYVIRAPGTNLVQVSDAVKARVAELEPELPAGTRMIMRNDESENVRAQLSDLRHRALFAGLVIFIVLLVFLRSFRSAAIVFATIAFSILIALNLVYWSGFTLNILTLMGMAMGFGLIVDNAIVVLENIYRRRRGGEPADVAAERGARDVVLPILAATMTTVVVLIPFVYLQGELRLYYVPLAVVVGFSLVASLFVAFSFIPALAGRLLRHDKKAAAAGAAAAGAAAALGAASAEAAGAGGPGDGGAAGSGLAGAGAVQAAAGQVGGAAAARPPIYIRFYSALLGYTLRYPWGAWSTVVLAAGILYGSYYLFDNYVTRNVLWFGRGPERTTIDIRVSQPRGADLEQTDDIVRYFEDRLSRMPELADFVTNVRTAQNANILVTFPDSLANTLVPVVIHEQLYAVSHQFGGADVRVFGPVQTFYGGGGGAPNYSIQVKGYNYEKVRDIAEDLGTRLSYISRVRDVDTNASAQVGFGRDRATEIVAVIDRQRLALYDLTAQDLVRRIQAAIRDAASLGPVRLGGDELQLQVKLDGDRDMAMHEFQELIIPTARGGGIRLGDVVTLEERSVLTNIRRENQQYERTVRYEFRGPMRLGDAFRDVIVEATELPAGYSIITRREFSFPADQRRQLWTVLAISIVMIFMVTAGLFESLRQPLCVLLAVPMALVGVFLVFFYVNAAFTREAYIGVIMMGGVVVNNAILLVDHVNQLRRRGGMALETALVRGTLDRVRPILMTSTTTVLGMLPLVLFSETVNANIWNALAYALIGGLTSSTIFILTVTPALYLLFERPAERRRLATVAGQG